ncbi:hypothetical protein CYY_002285 [Polysphondylium violaceum]|uniref:Importin N-terminal domain-containing protein n=1 Tax=Polysphondylium violaceum TaxID=133409 RepID=A0A8J4PX31_9MYCE|nr:hypothetical protein CYY_002285 [Polysphondylium violaceum]
MELPQSLKSFDQQQQQQQQQHKNTNDDIEPKPTIDNISQALCALYKSNDPTQINFAQKWLIQFQTLPIAWDIAPLLLCESNIFELQYFGASTIEHKLRNEWSKYNIETKAKILPIIVKIVQNSSNYQTCIVTRICVALSLTVMYTYPHVWENAILDIIHLATQDIYKLDLHNTNNNHYNLENLKLVLEFLSILPTELLKENDQYQNFKQVLKKVIDHVYIFLLSVIKSSNDLEKVKLAFKALASWLKYMLPVTSNLLLCTFQISFDTCLQQEQLLESLPTILEGSAVCLHQRVSADYTEAFNYAMERSLHSLGPIFNKVCQEQDDTKAIPLLNVFIQFLISDEQSIFAKETISRCLEMVLSFISIANREVCSMIFNLLDDYKSHPTLVALEPEKVKFFFLTLLDRFKDLSMYPLDYPSDPDNGDEETDDDLDEDIATFRANTTCCFIFAERNKVVEKTLFHHYLVNQLSQKIGQGVMVWQAYESILYYLYSLSESSNEAQSEFVPILLKLIPSIPVKSTPLIRSSIGLVGKYSFFLKDKSFYLEKVIFDLLPAFNCKPLVATAAESFSSICINNECATILFSHINRIIELCQPVLFGCKVQTNPVVVTIYKALFYIIQTAKSIKEFTPPFQQLVAPIIHNLTQLVNSNNNSNSNSNNSNNSNGNGHHYNNKLNVSNQDKPILLIQLEILASISQMIEFDEFENTTHSDAPYQYFQTIVPLLGKILATYNLDFEALNNIVIIYRWPILFTKNIVTDFLEEILYQVTQSYLQYPFSPLLQVISAMISLTNLPPTFEKKLEYSITSISTLTINQFPKVSNNDNNNNSNNNNIDIPLIDFSTQPDATKDYLFLIMHTLKSRPQCVDRSIVSTLCVSIIYYILDTKDINTTKNCCNFLYGVLSIPSNADLAKSRELVRPVVDNLLQIHGATLINNLIHGLFSGIVSSISLIQFFSDILYSLNNLNEKQFKLDITQIIMNTHTFLPTLHSSDERQNFVSELTTKVNMTEYRSKVRKLVLLANAAKITN